MCECEDGCFALTFFKSQLIYFDKSYKGERVQLTKEEVLRLVGEARKSLPDCEMRREFETQIALAHPVITAYLNRLDKEA